MRPRLPRRIASIPSIMKEAWVTVLECFRWASTHISAPMPLLRGERGGSADDVSSAGKADKPEQTSYCDDLAPVRGADERLRGTRRDHGLSRRLPPEGVVDAERVPVDEPLGEPGPAHLHSPLAASEVVPDDRPGRGRDEHGARLVDPEVALEDAQAHEAHECENGPDSLHVSPPFKSTSRSSRWESKAARSSGCRARSARPRPRPSARRTP